MELLRQDGTLKARGKLLADLQEEAYQTWKQDNDETIMEDVVIGKDEDGNDIVEQRQVNVFEQTVTEDDLDNYLKLNYAICRKAEYPDASEYLDAVVKGDEVAMKAYTDKCLAVKAKYPKA